jgi:hypothetical protein
LLIERQATELNSLNCLRLISWTRRAANAQKKDRGTGGTTRSSGKQTFSWDLIRIQQTLLKACSEAPGISSVRACSLRNRDE